MKKSQPFEWKPFTEKEIFAWMREAIPGIEDSAEVVAKQCNTRVQPLLEQNARLLESYLVDENGNEYVQVCMLKKKIRELQTELSILRTCTD